MNNVLKVYNILFNKLLADVPVLSGNTQQHIRVISVKPNEIEIEVEAPFYDLAEWKKTKRIQHTGKVIGGYTDYAEWVNNSGGFGTKNASMHWVNRCLYDTAIIVANEIEAQVDNRLPL